MSCVHCVVSELLVCDSIICIQSGFAIRPNTNRLFDSLFGAEVNILSKYSV